MSEGTSDYRYDVYTGMAIDAFRKHANIQRRLAKAEAEMADALSRMPHGDVHLYALNTELIRLELDRRAAEQEQDHQVRREEIAAVDKLIVEYRDAIRKEEAKLASLARHPSGSQLGVIQIKPGTNSQ